LPQACIVRPFGAIVFGRVGDLIGRKYALSVDCGFAALSIAVLDNAARQRRN
jgi:MFS family permease